MTPFTITTPLYYVNDKAHLGSIYTTIACDAIARFQRQMGEDVIFITGVDEHGLKIQRTASQKQTTPKQHCDDISNKYQSLWNAWNITNDQFIRTTSDHHKELVFEFFDRVSNTGDIYLGRQLGWYCVGCEEYKEVSEGEKNPICSIHQKELEWRDEENLFFRLSKYQSEIEQLIARSDFIFPISRRNEIINFVSQGLKDFSISRVNLNWGIPVPGHQGHTFYVWFDALLGYLSALTQSNTNLNLSNIESGGWPASIHVIGKDILRFHAVYWPAMLLSAGLNLPKRIFGHGFLTREGQKMGKSLGNVLDPIELLETYGRDSVRWYLLRDIQFGQDGDFQQQRFLDIVNNDLANTIGNLLNRTSSMSRKWFNESIPVVDAQDIANHYLANEALQAIEIVKDSFQNLKFNLASESILNFAIKSNVYLNEKSPWSLMKIGGNDNQVMLDIYAVLESVRIIGLLLNPIVPDLSGRILNQLGVAENNRSWEQSLHWGLLKQGGSLPPPVPVMNKLEDKI